MDMSCLADTSNIKHTHAHTVNHCHQGRQRSAATTFGESNCLASELCKESLMKAFTAKSACLTYMLLCLPTQMSTK